MADVCEVESELGGLVYQSLGTVSFSHPEEAADFPVPPGYARLVAVSSRYGLTVLADHAGLCVAHTARLAEVCESLKEKLPAEQIVPGDDFTRVPLRGASHVSFSPDERTLAAVAGCAVHLFQTKDLDGSRSPDGAGGASAAAAFRTQVLGDDDEAVRDLQWLAEFAGGASYLALVATEQDTEGERAKLVVGSAMTLDQTAPVAIAEGVRAFAVARGPDDDDDVFEPEEPPAEDAASGANARGALAAWAPFGGGAVVARLTDAGYSAEMTHYPVGPCEEGAADVVVNGLAFLVGDEAPAGQKTTSRAATLLALCTDREDPESHRALALAVGPPGPGGEGPSVAFELSGAFAIDDDETAGLVGPYAHARRVREWDVALASHRKAWDNQLCAVRPPARKPDGSIAPPCVLDVEDDRCVPSIPLAGEDEDSNFVVGLALDTTGCGGRMTHPADKSRPKLPQGPLVLVATADARLTCMRLGNMDEDAGVRFEAARVRPPRAEIPASPALAGSPAPSPPGSAAKTKLFASPEEAKEAPATAPTGSTPPPPASGFGAAFLAKANAGYAKAQKALEEELEASAKPASAAFPAAPAPGSAPAFNFGFGGDKGSAAPGSAATSSPFSAPAFGTTPAPASAFGAAPAFGTTAAAPAAFTFTGATATPVPVNPGSGFGFGTPPSGGKAKDAASPESEKKPELPAAETKPAAAGGFNFGGGASATSASPFASAAATGASPFASAAKPAAGGLDFGGTTTAAPAKAVETALVPPAPAAAGFNFGGAASAPAFAAPVASAPAFSLPEAAPKPLSPPEAPREPEA